MKFTLPENTKKRLLILNMALVNFYALTSYSIIQPFFPIEGKEKGLPPSIIGIIFGCYEFVNFACSLPFGMWMLPYVGSKFMYQSGIFLEGGCSVLMGILGYGPSGETFFWMSLIVRMVQAFGACMTITSSFAIVAEVFPDRVSTIFGVLELFTGAGLMLGPVIGGFIYDLGGYAAPFYVVGVFCLVMLVFTLIFFPYESRYGDLRTNFKVFKIFKQPKTIIVIMNAAVNCFSFTFINPAFQPFLEKNFGLSPSLVGLVFLSIPLPYALLSPLWGYLVDTHNITIPLQVLGNFISTLGFFLINPTPLLNTEDQHYLWLTILSTCLLGISGGAALVPTIKELMNQALLVGLPDDFDTYSIVAGVANTTFSLGLVLGPIFSGSMVEKIGFGWASTIVAFISLSSSILTVIYLAIVRLCSCHQGARVNEGQFLSEYSERFTPNVKDYGSNL